MASASSDHEPSATGERPRIENRVVIRRPVEDVFAFMNEPTNEPLWQPGTISSAYTSEAPVGVGTTGRSISRSLGRTTAVEWTITDYERNRIVTWVTTVGDLRWRTIWRFDSAPEGMHVTVIQEALDDMRGLSKMFGRLSRPIIVRIRTRTMRSELQNLKRLLEA